MDERKALNKNSVCVWLCHRCSVPTQQSAVFALKPEEPVYYCIIGFKLIMANRRSCAFLWCGSVHLTALSMSEECRYLPRAINNLLPRVQRCPRTICIITWNHIVLRGWLKLPPLHDCVVCRGVVVLNMEVSRGNIPCVDCAAPSAVIYLHRCVQTTAALLCVASIAGRRPLCVQFLFLHKEN